MQQAKGAAERGRAGNYLRCELHAECQPVRLTGGYIPRGCVASADDIAGPIAFLLSDDSVHVTGTILSVNGGSVLASY